MAKDGSEQGSGKVGINTRLAHSGNNPHDYFGFVNPPVVHASTVLFPNAAAMAARNQKYTYGTRGTPTTDALAQAIDALEGSAGTIVVPSGLAAVTIPLLAFVSAGDHLLIVDSVYHPTRNFADTMLKRLGVEVEYYAPRIGAGIAALIKPNTKVVFTESPASNTFEVQDIPAIAKAAHAAGAIVMMDNTWATPLYFRPLDHGVDISIHAATKYPAGHSDVLLGTVSANEACWKQLYESFCTLGCCSGPDDVYQVLRGLRTMGVRLDHHQRSALAIASWLESQPGVARVLHPALPSHPDHDLWKRDFCGSSGIFSIVLAGGGQREQHAFLDALRIFGLGYSWGGYESLAVPVWLVDRVVAKGPYEGPLIRLQIGLEDVDDLKADIMRGLAAAAA
ncbi:MULTISPECIES: cystathionine beta-lyase [unclassified Mesorhizobium]|uniref:cystathionine beta-lyase n=1 Tax=unclassified Mesorhizobium TaxID=325217 RepID=UPI000FD564E6|nr:MULTISPECIES: cystathionine beta-lyase [unclassified Mesorhizobium]RUX06312.1 cystathionine beta-lyase [Mesorhizobium sp. M8A.F.Ca.ET.059.01.1.1]RVD49131.1 cystathionine beta-lyase [Mesorhizobium sp. M8A.F.Ca.ET.023.02.2.1]TGV09808.1 cystathionine beta-lyase [Mesorhizobium sp. M8A.F.Ca.ET.173.01.1.1]RWC71679.1 MAG: cystathionine beta-lyase [Mesorhizobium sp.]TGQ83462.1 cystathionine beta-lyase [Mesorhizobium sp. M8A.F.Ca.ET.207.01.1.1]